MNLPSIYKIQLGSEDEKVDEWACFGSNWLEGTERKRDFSGWVHSNFCSEVGGLRKKYLRVWSMIHMLTAEMLIDMKISYLFSTIVLTIVFIDL